MKKSTFTFWIGLAMLILISAPYFLQNIFWFFSERSVYYIIQGRWDWVFLYVGIFSVFLLFIHINQLKRGCWRTSANIYVAFIIALFAEMFGFPLSIYFLSHILSLSKEYYAPAVAFTFDIFGTRFSLLVTSLIAGIFSIIGVAFIVFGWKEIYRRKNELVTDGIFGFVRHPQYLGILMIATIWLFAWPTLITSVMWPVLVVSYYRLAKQEEKELEKRFGNKYLEYKDKTPMFIPL